MSALDAAPELDGASYFQALQALRDALQADVDRETRHALAVAVRGMAGYKASEIQQQLGIDRGEMESISRRLVRAGRRLLAESRE